MLIAYLLWSLLIITWTIASTLKQNEIKRWQYGYQGFSSMYTERIKIGISSKNYYLLESLSATPNNCVLRKMDTDFNEIWRTSYFVRPSVKMFDVDDSENKLMIGIYKNPLEVIELNATTGFIISANQFPNLTGISYKSALHSISDGSGYFIITQNSNSGLANVCKYTAAGVLCQEYNTDFVDGTLLLNDSTLFIMDKTPNNTFNMFKFIFGSTSFVWINSIDCPTFTCSSYRGEAVMNKEKTIIYSLFSFGTKNHFAVVNNTDGKIVGTRYILPFVSCGVNGLLLTGDTIIGIVSCTNYNIMIL